MKKLLMTMAALAVLGMTSVFAIEGKKLNPRDVYTVDTVSWTFNMNNKSANDVSILLIKMNGGNEKKEVIELSGIKVSKVTGAWLKILIAANIFYEQVSEELQDVANEGESFLEFDKAFKPVSDYIEGKIIDNIHEHTTFNESLYESVKVNEDIII